MKGLCEFLDVVTNPAIISVAVIEFVFMIIAIIYLVKFRIRISKLNSKKIVKQGKPKKVAVGQVTTKTEVELTQNWEDFDRFLAEYQEKSWLYSAFSLIIQIFTLLGILGTVAGLYLAMSNGQDMYRGVELALSTTVLGILFAIIYKIADVIIVSFLINYIDDGIERYEKIYHVKNDEAKVLE